jgi:UDP:flavonoid glycosyltransferase YjiC (YdhE family)
VADAGHGLWHPSTECPPLNKWLGDVASRELPIVYVQHGRSFGLQGFWDAFRVAARDVRAAFVVATDRLDQAIGALPDNIYAADGIPQAAVLSRARAVLSSATTTAVLGALASGVPGLLAPIGGEQPELADRCRRAGIATVIDPRCLRSDNLSAALNRVLSDGAMATRAREVAKDLANGSGFERSVQLLEGLTQS